jgi:hypothetical protein
MLAIARPLHGLASPSIVQDWHCAGSVAARVTKIAS